VFMTQKGSKRRGTRRWERLTGIRTAFDAACERAKLPDVTPHVLRHTFASRLVMRGADLRTVQELGGWKSLSMVQRYALLGQDHKRQAVELLVADSPTAPAAAQCGNGPNLSVVNRMGR
jgi:site-specific recombinase XerD